MKLSKILCAVGWGWILPWCDTALSEPVVASLKSASNPALHADRHIPARVKCDQHHPAGLCLEVGEPNRKELDSVLICTRRVILCKQKLSSQGISTIGSRVRCS